MDALTKTTEDNEDEELVLGRMKRAPLNDDDPAAELLNPRVSI